MHDEASMRYATARGYLLSCKMIMKSPDYSGKYIISSICSLHMLVAFGLELYLKAWLLGSGKASKDVRSHRHDIAKLFDDAKRNRLPPIQNLDVLVDHFADPHADFTYRYMMPDDEMDNTNWPAAFQVFDELDKEVDRFLGCSASHGLQPGH